jgi:hypothetical protein
MKHVVTRRVSIRYSENKNGLSGKFGALWPLGAIVLPAAAVAPASTTTSATTEE